MNSIEEYVVTMNSIARSNFNATVAQQVEKLVEELDGDIAVRTTELRNVADNVEFLPVPRLLRSYVDADAILWNDDSSDDSKRSAMAKRKVICAELVRRSESFL